ncbi:MAG: N-acetylmuramoyl-L-alanine amidase [Lachnospiraceae bacterium]|nr:N-acetylmuramoyl-L-alanine amidase [Lachnospiraceae bacterium]
MEVSEKGQMKEIERRAKARARKRARQRRKKRRIMYTMWFSTFMMVMFGVLLAVFVVKKAVPAVTEYVEQAVSDHEPTIVIKEKPLKVWEPPEFEVNFLTPNQYSRPQEELRKINNIFVHYTANPGTTAAQNRSYFENLGTTGETSASAHFVIGYEGEIIQCLPFEEIGYAVQQHNYDSISIECCYLNDDGSFTDATKESLIHLLAWLIGKFDLTTDDILRHYDSNGKMCPKYYAEHEDEWEDLKKQVDLYIMQYGTTEADQTQSDAANEFTTDNSQNQIGSP